MAFSQSPVNEKSSIYEESSYDPDLEARLYAEIYYSNDNYQPDTSSIANDTQNASKASSSLHSENFVDHDNPKADERSGQNLSSINNFVGDKNCQNVDSGLKQRFVKRPRLLAHKNLWLSPINQFDDYRNNARGNFELREAESISERYRNNRFQEFGDYGRNESNFEGNPIEFGNSRDFRQNCFDEPQSDFTAFRDTRHDFGRFNANVQNQNNSTRFSGGRNDFARFNDNCNDSTRFSGGHNDFTPFDGAQNNPPPLFNRRNDFSRFHGDRSNSPRFNGAQNDSPRFRGVQNDSPRFRGARNDSPRFRGGQNDSPRFRGAQNYSPRFNVAQNVSSRFNVAQNHSRQLRGAQNNSPRFRGPQYNSPRFSGVQNDFLQFTSESTDNRINSTQFATKSIDNSTNSARFTAGSIDNSLNSTQFATESIDDSLNSTQFATESIDNPLNSTQFATESIDTSLNSTQFTTEPIDNPLNSTLFATESIDNSLNSTQFATEPIDNPVNSTQFATVSIDHSLNSTQFAPASIDNSLNSTEFSTEPIDNPVNSTQFATDSIDNSLNSTQYTTEPIDNPLNSTPFEIVSIDNSLDSTPFATESTDNTLNSTQLSTESIDNPLSSTQLSSNSIDNPINLPQTGLIGARTNCARLFGSYNNSTRISTDFHVDRSNNRVNESSERPINSTRDIIRFSERPAVKSVYRTRSTTRLLRNNRNLSLPDIDEVYINFSEVLNDLTEVQNSIVEFDDDDLNEEIILRNCSRVLETKYSASKKREKNRLRRKAQKELKNSFNTNSKYKVIDKKNKIKMRENEPVDISSDSDDSILEVPVPPKAPPPIIQLQDSDDENDEIEHSKKKSKKHSDKQDSSYVIDSSSNADESSEDNQRSKKSKNSNNSQESISTEKPTKSRSKKDKKSSKSIEDNVEVNNDIENAEIENSRPPKEVGKKNKNTDNSIGNISITENPEDSGKSSKSKSRKSKKSIGENSSPVETESINENSVVNRELELQKILKEASRKAKIAAEKVKIALEKARIAEEKARIAEEKLKSVESTLSSVSTNVEDTNLILNCTEIQKGASSLEEIKKNRENIANIHSDDSMTESEANSWMNISAGQTSCEQNENSTTDTINATVWNETTDETTETINEIVSNEAIPSNNEELNSSIDPTTPRKRHKDTPSSPFNDFDVPAIPEKRAKQKMIKTSKDLSTTEYFFKPMTKEMETFYNNPWGGENLEICDIQSRMPKNPNCWTILDTDLQGPSPRRKKLCPRCKKDSHFGKRCPEKAKPQCCYMCGAQGHTESRCPEAMCLTCGRKYANFRPICGFCTKLHCTMCNGTGHNNDNCPDLWRRYHNTTTETLPVPPLDVSFVMKPVHNLICCNCSKRGHEISTCRQLRWSQHFQNSMNISSYTSGPSYEPSNRDRLLNPAYSGNSSSEIPENVENSETATREPFVAMTRSDNIDFSDLQDGNSFLNVDFSNSKCRMIFKTGELRPHVTSKWVTKEIQLDKKKNLHLTGLLNGTLKPIFLENLQNSFEFGIEIMHNPESGVYLRLQCSTIGIMHEFERLLFQWLGRRDTEKTYLVYNELPYMNVERLKATLQSKLMMLRTASEPSKLLRKIVACEFMAKNASENLNNTGTKKNQRRLTCAKINTDMSATRKGQLVTSLYAGSWVDGGDSHVANFCQLVNHRQLKLDKPLPKCNYLWLIYLYNELFTFHETPALKGALAKAMAQNPNAPKFTYPSDEVCQNVSQTSEPEKTTSDQSLPINDDNAVGSTSQLPENSGDNPVHLPQKPKKSKLKMKKKDRIRHTNMPLTSLPPSGQRKYLRMADCAIKRARISKDPNLQNIADCLESKLSNSTAGTRDVLYLYGTVHGNSNVGFNPYNTLVKFGGTTKLRKNYAEFLNSL